MPNMVWMVETTLSQSGKFWSTSARARSTEDNRHRPAAAMASAQNGMIKGRPQGVRQPLRPEGVLGIDWIEAEGLSARSVAASNVGDCRSRRPPGLGHRIVTMPLIEDHAPPVRAASVSHARVGNFYT